MEEETSKKATLIVTISKYSLEKIQKYYNVDAAKVRIVPNGVDPEKFKPFEDPAGSEEAIRIREVSLACFSSAV